MGGLIIMNKWFSLFGFVGLCLFSVFAYTAPLPAEAVFQAAVRVVDPNSFFITWQIKPSYFLYADRIKLSAEKEACVTLGTLQFPPSLTKTDKLGNHYAVYRDELVLPIPVLGQQAGKAFLSVAYQGCADDGFCYPPTTRRIQLTIDDHLALTAVKFVKPLNEAAPTIPPTQRGDIMAVFNAHYWPVTLLIFFGLGLLLSFTPCVLPMIPVLSGIIVGHDKISTQKAFGLSLSYVLSMACTYAFIGVMVALLGENLQITMQSPLIISLFSSVFVLLALSMFGLFDLKMPISWQAKLAQLTRQQSSGHYHYINAAVMGCLSTLVLSPCVTAPLVGALGYIADSGNLFLGGAALFALGLGMGAPLLLIGTSAGKWLPKAGPWMNAVKSFFGMLLLSVAIYLLSRILPASLTMALWAILLIFSGIYVGACTPGKTHSEKFKQSFGIALLVYGLLLFLGASMGNDNPLQPLKNLTIGRQADKPTSSLGLSEHIVTHAAQLNEILVRNQGKPVMLDFYADWCTSCKVMEATTFNEPEVKQALARFVVIKVDITQNNAEEQALLKEYNVIAPPTFIFLDSQGQEVTESRLVGEISSQDFMRQLTQIE